MTQCTDLSTLGYSTAAPLKGSSVPSLHPFANHLLTPEVLEGGWVGGPTGQRHPTVKEHAGGGLFIRLLILSFHSSPPLKSQHCQRQLSPNPAVQQMLCLYPSSTPAPPKRNSRGVSLFSGEATQAGSRLTGVLLLAAAGGTRKPGLRKQGTGHMGVL